MTGQTKKSKGGLFFTMRLFFFSAKKYIWQIIFCVIGVKKYIWQIIFCVIGVIIGVYCEISFANIMANIIDIGVNKFDLKYIVDYGLIMISLGLCGILFDAISVYFSAYVTQNCAFDLRKKVFDKIQEFEFKNIDKFSTASLITRVTNDINNLQMTFMMMLRIFLRAPVNIIFAFSMLVMLDSQMALIILAIIPAFVLIILLIMKNARPKFLAVQKMLDRINAIVQEKLINIRLIKSFCRENFEQKKFNLVVDDLMLKSLKAFNIVILTMPTMIFLLDSTTLIIWWIGGNKFLNSGLEIGKLSAFISYIFHILFSVMLLSYVILLFARSKASSLRIKEILDEKVDFVIKEKNFDGAEKIKIDVLEFDKVDFKYKDDDKEFVLKDINFKIERGETLAIIGSTSSGKSTLVNLIPRFFDINSGEIKINNKNIRDYDLNLLRNSIGFVMQKNILFSGSIEENIKLGNQKADLNEIKKACEIAQANDFILNLKDKYETELGQMGVNLSGGQKQRLCIARAILKEPEILILDDSTSAVDSLTEKKIYDGFDLVLKNKIKIIVAQRISSIKNADKIIVLDNGKICGIGKHEELLRENKIYREICESQNKLNE